MARNCHTGAIRSKDGAIKEIWILQVLSWGPACQLFDLMSPFDPRANLRSSQRISITISGRSYELLSQRSGAEGRSLSNLASYLLETSLPPPRSIAGGWAES